MCDGVSECTKAVREQIREQADVIKIMTSGGVLSAYDSPIDAQFSVEEVTAMVEVQLKNCSNELAFGTRAILKHLDSNGQNFVIGF
jgi:hypothetical protein